MVTAPETEASEGDEFVVEKDAVLNKTTGKRYAVEPLSPARQAIIDAGSLIPYTRQIVLIPPTRGLSVRCSTS